jgi:hypothetical protein
MPIADIYGNPLVHHVNFPIDEVRNIEFGAGKNYFGKREFPNCYITNLTTPNLLHFTHYPNYETVDCHYLDATCDYYEYNFNREFENIILCNPYHFGFSGLGDGKRFFDRAGDLLCNEGKIHIIGSSLNKWCARDSYDDYMSNEIEEFKSIYEFELLHCVPIPRQHLFNTTYKFYKSELLDRTYPDQMLVIKKL